MINRLMKIIAIKCSSSYSTAWYNAQNRNWVFPLYYTKSHW